MDSLKVAECSYYSCSIKDDNQGRYSFTNDSISGIFTFTIHPITLAYNEKVIGCSDGENTEEEKTSL